LLMSLTFLVTLTTLPLMLSFKFKMALMLLVFPAIAPPLKIEMLVVIGLDAIPLKPYKSVFQ